MSNDSNTKLGFIYALVDPRDQAVRYIGQTTNLVARLSGHNNEHPSKPTHKNNWIKALKKLGLTPIMEIVETVPLSELDQREQYWIAVKLSEGCDLTNIAIPHSVINDPAKWARFYSREEIQYGVNKPLKIKLLIYENEVYYSCVHFTELFGKTQNPRQYWSTFKRKIPQWALDMILPMPFPSKNGRFHLTDAAPKPVIDYLIMEMPSTRFGEMRTELWKKIAHWIEENYYAGNWDNPRMDKFTDTELALIYAATRS